MTMPSARKAADYDERAVRAAIVDAFKRRKGEAAPADIVAFTGLPAHQVKAELPAVADEFGGRLKVTESGEILYSFPGGYRSRYKGFGPALGRFLRAAGKALRAAGVFLFKAWIMVMLVGYFALFVALAVLAVVASVAVSASDKNGRSRSRGGGNLVMGLIDLFVRIWFYNEVFKSPGQRRYEVESRARKRENRRPLHKAIFSFVFGEADPNADHEAARRRAFVALARERKGVVLLEDFMAVTGLSPAEADREISRYLYEFEGEPEVSDEGTVYYRFPSLLLRARGDDGGASDSPLKKLRPFSANAKSSNAWYAAINGVNLAFGSYFLYHALAYPTIVNQPVSAGNYLFWFVGNLLSQVSANPLGVMTVGLGAVPIAFSVLFWLIPALRKGSVDAQNERIKRENLRMALYAQALASPGAAGEPDPRGLPDAARPASKGAAKAALEELAAYEGGEPLPDGRWRLPELERKLGDVQKVRASVRPEDSSLGGVAFDSGS